MIRIEENAILIGKPGQKIIVHVNRHHVRKNDKLGLDLPLYTVKVGGKTLYAWQVIKTGPSILEDHSHDPLHCGARAYDVTYDPVILLNMDCKSFEGITFEQAKQMREFKGEFMPVDDEVCPVR